MPTKLDNPSTAALAVRLLAAAAAFFLTSQIFDVVLDNAPFAFYGRPYEHGFDSFSCYVWSGQNITALAILSASAALFLRGRLLYIAIAPFFIALSTVFIAHLPFAALYALNHERSCSMLWLFPAILCSQTLPLLAFISSNAPGIAKKCAALGTSCLILSISAAAFTFPSYNGLIDTGDHAHFHANFHIFLFSIPALASAAALSGGFPKASVAWAIASSIALLATASFGYHLFILPTVALLPWLAHDFGRLLSAALKAAGMHLKRSCR